MQSYTPCADGKETRNVLGLSGARAGLMVILFLLLAPSFPNRFPLESTASDDRRSGTSPDYEEDAGFDYIISHEAF